MRDVFMWIYHLFLTGLDEGNGFTPSDVDRTWNDYTSISEEIHSDFDKNVKAVVVTKNSDLPKRDVWFRISW